MTDNEPAQRPSLLVRQPGHMPFVLIPVPTLLDTRMTPAALGVLAYLLHRADIPGGWRFYPKEIATHFETGKTGKEVAVRLQELERLGYLTRETLRDHRGRTVGTKYTVRSTSDTATPAAGTRFAGSRPTSTRDAGTTKKEINKKEKTKLSASADGGFSSQHTARASDSLRAFLDVWLNHGNPARMARHRALDREQVDVLRELIEAHQGDQRAALASWTATVQRLAAVETRDPGHWWGKPDEPRRGLASAARHWSKYVDLTTETQPPAARSFVEDVI